MKLSLFISALCLLPAILPAEELAPIPKEVYTRLATEMETHLDKHILKPWFPRAVDKERGGFIQDYSEDWTEKRDGKKSEGVGSREQDLRMAEYACARR
jgi:hypothetical protein